jgi:uncharacterized membrane protein HdeD (DUF308 family)
MLFKRSKWGLTLLAIWLIATGLVQFFAFSIPYLPLILGGVAIVAGVLLLLDR